MNSINKFNEIINNIKDEVSDDSDDFVEKCIENIDKEMTLIELEEIQDSILGDNDYSEGVRIAFTTVVFNKTTKNISNIISKIEPSTAAKSIIPQDDPSTSILLGLINLSCFLGLCFLLS